MVTQMGYRDNKKGILTMEFITKIKTILQGYKTYLVGVGAIIAAILAFIGGEMDIVATVQSIIAAVMTMTVRAGVATAAKAIKKSNEPQ